VTSVVLVDGRVAGLWDTPSPHDPRVRISLQSPVADASERAIANRAAQVGEFFYGSPVSVERVTSIRPLAERAPSALLRPLA
jgi:hypothetical protein